MENNLCQKNTHCRFCNNKFNPKEEIWFGDQCQSCFDEMLKNEGFWYNNICELRNFYSSPKKIEIMKIQLN